MTAPHGSEKTLRLIWPQWQGAEPGTVGQLTPELPIGPAQLGYHLGSLLLQAIVPAGDGPEAIVPVDMRLDDLGVRDGIFAREVLLGQLRAALEIIAEHDPDRIVTLGGECSTSVAPFAYLAANYGSDLAVVWVDAHPDTGMPESRYDGYHGMALSHILGHGDPEFVGALPGVVDASRVAIAGLHVWEPDQEPFTTGWGLATFAPEKLNASPQPLLDWLRATGCSKVVVHFDVDSIDSKEIVFGLGAAPDGLTREAVVGILGGVAEIAEVVGITVAEYVPRQVIALQQLLLRLPLLGATLEPRT